MSDNILKIDGLSKTFRSHWVYKPIEAVKNVSLEIKRGESFGFLGSNGAGKTTTIKCIIGLIHKTRGRIYFCNEELKQAKQHKKIGFLPEQPYFYEHLSVLETLDFFARLHGLKSSERKAKVKSTLERVGLADREKSNVRTLSKGLQQRLAFAQAIINDPELLLLDEPFSGLDPIGRKDMREIINDFHKLGTTIFMSSHILPDVEDICSRVSIMDRGSIKSEFNIAEIPELFGESYEIIASDIEENSELSKKLFSLCCDSSIKKRSAKEVLAFKFTDYEKAASALKMIDAANKQIYSFESIKPDLEEIFVKVTSQ